MYKKVYAAAFLGCIAVLPMSDTIALRNILLGVMLALFAGGIGFSSTVRSDAAVAVKWVPIPLILWIVYLCLFPLWAPLPEVAWENLRGQWGESIVAWVVAFGAVVVLGKQGPGLWSLGIASAFPLLVHLALSILAVAGIWSSDFYDHQNLTGLYEEVSRWVRGEFVFGNFHNPIAERFHGIEVMHGNAGYASSVAIAIFTAIFFGSRDQVRPAESALSLLAIGLCFLSVAIFRSRGALLFGVFIVAAGFAWHYGSARAHSRSGASRSALVLALFLVIGSITYWSVQNDKRWAPMLDKVVAGLMVEDPIGTLCRGISEKDEAKLRQRLVGQSEDYVDKVITGLKGQDGGRILLMRAGTDIMLENPWGYDGSRESYQGLIRLKCHGEPILGFSHSHNSWIDLSLAIGWLGMALFFSIFYQLFTAARKRIISSCKDVSFLALGLLTIFWVFRGFFDSLYREHYLEMQATILMYLYISAAPVSES